MRSFTLVVLCCATQSGCSQFAGFGDFTVRRDGGSEVRGHDASPEDARTEAHDHAEDGFDIIDARDAAEDGEVPDPCDKCDDGISCTFDICDVETCFYEPNHRGCAEGLYCDPEAGGCVPPPIVCGEDPDCVPLGNPCLDDRCEDGRCYPLHDADGDGQAATTCGGGDCDDANPLIFFGAEETCDGVDEDCDGVVDRISRPCRADEGPCGEGAEVCRDGLWGACAPVPRGEEIGCNGLDDNCNGVVDELGGCWTEMVLGPEPRTGHAMVLTPDGTVIVWGGDTLRGATNTGGIYDPVSDSWRPTQVENAPGRRYALSAAWTEQGMLVFGGYNGSSAEGTGGIFNPTTNTWVPIANSSGRWSGSATWVPAANVVVVFGGKDPGWLGVAGSYHLPTNTWLPSTNEMAPSARTNHVAVLDPTRGRVMILNGSTPDLLGDGATYDPLADLWSPIATEGAPPPREYACATWVAELDAMLVLGGTGGEHTGAFYFPGSNHWQSISIPDDLVLPGPCMSAWTGNELVILWAQDGVMVGTRYQPTTDRWLPIPRMLDSPPAQWWFTMAWTDNTAMYWGGVSEGDRPVGTGYRLRIVR